MNCKKGMIAAALAAMVALTSGAGELGKEHHEIYIVQSGDTLWSIASVYTEKNTYGKGYIREYIFAVTHDWNRGIFENRHNAEIYPGDKLNLRYWTSCAKVDE